MKNKYVVTAGNCLISFATFLFSIWILSYRFYQLTDSRYYWMILFSFLMMGQFLTGWVMDFFGRSQKFTAFGLCLVLLGRYFPIPILCGAVMGIGLAFASSGFFLTIRNQTIGKSQIFGTWMGLNVFGGYLGYVLGSHQVVLGSGATALFFLFIGLCLMTVEKPNAIYMKNHLSKQEKRKEFFLCFSLMILGLLSTSMNFQWNHLQNYDIIYVLGIAFGMGAGTIFWNQFPHKWLFRLFTMLGALCFLYGNLPAVGMLAGISYGMLVSGLTVEMLKLSANRPGRTVGVTTTAFFTGMIPWFFGWDICQSSQMTGAGCLFLLFILCLTPFLGFSDAN